MERKKIEVTEVYEVEFILSKLFQMMGGFVCLLFLFFFAALLIAIQTITSIRCTWKMIVTNYGTRPCGVIVIGLWNPQIGMLPSQKKKRTGKRYAR